MGDPQTAPLFCQLGLHRWASDGPFPNDHPYTMTTRMLYAFFIKREHCVRQGCGAHRQKSRNRWRW